MPVFVVDVKVSPLDKLADSEGSESSLDRCCCPEVLVPAVDEPSMDEILPRMPGSELGKELLPCPVGMM